MPSEMQAAGLAVYAKDGNVVTALVATIEELARWVEVEAPRIIASCPFFSQECQLAVGGHGKDADAVVQTIARIDKFPVARYQNFGAEITAGKSGRQRRDGLASGQPTCCWVVVKESDCRTFLLDAVEPTTIRMKVEMSRSVARWQ